MVKIGIGILKTRIINETEYLITFLLSNVGNSERIAKLL